MIDDPRYKQLNTTEQLVLHLINWFDGNGKGCWRSAPTLADNISVDVRTVRRALSKLSKLGLITTRQEGPRVYRSVTPDTSVTPKTTTPVISDTPTPDTSVTLPLTPVSPKENYKNTISKHIYNPTKYNPMRELLMEIVSEELADDFISHRKSVKSPLTELSAKRIVNKLRNHHDPEAVLNLSIENGWKGIFPDQIKSAGEGMNGGNLQSRIMEEIYADRAAAVEDHHDGSGQSALGLENANPDQHQREGRLSATVHMLRAK